MRPKRLLWKLVPSYLLITVLSLLAVTWYATKALRDFYRGETRQNLRARARLIEPQVLNVLTGTDRQAVDALCKERGKLSGTRITVMLPAGEVVGDSDEDPARMENHATEDRPEMITALESQVGVSTRYSRTLKREMMYLAVPLLQADDLVGVLRTSVPVMDIQDALQQVYGRLVTAGVIIALVACAVCFLVSRRITQPLQEMEAGAERFARGRFQERLPVPDTEELGRLAGAMNQMAVQLDEELRTIRRQRNEQEAILASMVEGVLAVDNDERLITVNHAAADMLHIERDNVQGRSIQEVVRNTALQQFVTRALTASEPVETEFNIGDGEERALQGHGAVLRDAQDQRIGAVVVLNDVTRLRCLEDVRRQFVANVSHELKTPITSIKGFVETLVDGAMRNPEDAERFLGIIAKQVDRLNAIIEDLLVLSRLEQDPSEVAASLEEHSVRHVLEAAIEVCGMKAAEKHIDVTVQCPEDLRVRMNAALLEQAVVNLVDNAIIYSEPESHVQIGAAGHEDEVLITVRDQGCGIAREHLPRLFERFYRIDKARSRKLGGTGLGLAIVKHIAQVHGGTVTVDSTPGEGSIFTVHLPRGSGSGRSGPR